MTVLISTYIYLTCEFLFYVYVVPFPSPLLRVSFSNQMFVLLHIDVSDDVDDDELLDDDEPDMDTVMIQHDGAINRIRVRWHTVALCFFPCIFSLSPLSPPAPPPLPPSLSHPSPSLLPPFFSLSPLSLFPLLPPFSPPPFPPSPSSLLSLPPSPPSLSRQPHKWTSQ